MAAFAKSLAPVLVAAVLAFLAANASAAPLDIPVQCDGMHVADIVVSIVPATDTRGAA